jgi:hypothetical protein
MEAKIQLHKNKMKARQLTRPNSRHKKSLGLVMETDF